MTQYSSRFHFPVVLRLIILLVWRLLQVQYEEDCYPIHYLEFRSWHAGKVADLGVTDYCC